MPEYAYIPAAMSAAEMPTLDGVSGVPVMETSLALHEQVVGFLRRSPR
jgi:hypothetical protein